MRTTVTTSYIDVTPEVRAKLARTFHVMEKTVYLALTYRRNNETARRIRYTAVNEYGAKPMHHCPMCETLHETTENGHEVMRQIFDNGAVLTWYKPTREVVVTHKGAEVLHEDCTGLERFAEIQLYAESL